MNTARAFATAVALFAAAPALAEKKPLGAGERVDLNRAGAADLMRLPGVGKKRAQAILARRTRQPFRRPEDLLAVKGISAEWLDRVKGHLAVSAASRAPTPAASSAAAPKR